MRGQPSNAGNPTDLPFSAAVIQLLADANGEAGRLQHEYIGTEHLVLALSQHVDEAGPLVALSVEPNRVNQLIHETVRRGAAAVPSDIERPLTSRTKQALSLAATTAHELGHTNIGVAHLLVGLMRERGNIGAQVLADQGLTEERAYEYARRYGAPRQFP